MTALTICSTPRGILIIPGHPKRTDAAKIG
jgi:hypothetical protein